MQADSGMAGGRYFVDSCCSKTTVRDRQLLKNMRPLTTPARVVGLSGIKTINQQADVHLPVIDVNGKRTVKYNMPQLVKLLKEHGVINGGENCRRSCLRLRTADGGKNTAGHGDLGHGRSSHKT